VEPGDWRRLAAGLDLRAGRKVVRIARGAAGVRVDTEAGEAFAAPARS
jgi:hypothetical protein